MPITHLITPIMSPVIRLAETGCLPDAVLRQGIRSLLRQRLKSLREQDAEKSLRQFLEHAQQGPVACLPEKANQQHYEVPAEFFQIVLGTHLKYSCCFYDSPDAPLDAAEAAALRRTCQHAGLQDGQTVLDLGCGWGSLSLWMAEHYPGSRILAVSNSHSQREYILQQAERRGLLNLEVRTCDINEFSERRRFDRVVSVEMFEHVRNHALLLQRISNWLLPHGRLLVHIFCHQRFTYLFEETGTASWMARHFFSGGVMPGRDLLMHLQQHLVLEQTWDWSGLHYARTAEDWLSRMDDQQNQIAAILQQAYGEEWKLWRQRWRIFFMACAELFAWNRGQEWFVTHYLFQNRGEPHVRGNGGSLCREALC